MSLQDNFKLMAKYNEQMNDSLYDVSSRLTREELLQDRKLFFDSVLGTLNHILVGDTIWLMRFRGHPRQFESLKCLNTMKAPLSLTEILHSEFSQLCNERQRMDKVIIALADESTDADYETTLTYTSTKGKVSSKKFGHLMQHLFNHQTHHRGQLTTIFSQADRDYGSTDLLMSMPDL